MESTTLVDYTTNISVFFGSLSLVVNTYLNRVGPKKLSRVVADLVYNG